MKPAPPDPAILEYCTTEYQREALGLWAEMGGPAAEVAKKLKTTTGTIPHPETLVKLKKLVEKKAAKAGWTPKVDNTDFVAEGYHIKGVSSFTDGDGNVLRQWVKTDQDKEEQQRALREFIEGLQAEIKPKKPVKNKTKKADESLMASIFIGDAHHCAYAWSTETKHFDYDSDIASLHQREAIDDLVERSPNASVGLLVEVGDYFHINTSHGTTWAGTPQDYDTRFSRSFGMAGQALNYAVSRMLEKFPKVVVCIAKGNHDTDLAVCIQHLVSAYWRLEPRVTVLETNGPHHYIEYGRWLIGVNHGDKIKPEQLVQVMARDMPKAWGRAKCRMWALGHVHHQDVKEINGCIVQRFAALPPPDAWHSSMGYGSTRAMQMIVFKKEGGRHSTLIYELPPPDTEPDVVIE